MMVSKKECKRISKLFYLKMIQKYIAFTECQYSICICVYNENDDDSLSLNFKLEPNNCKNEKEEEQYIKDIKEKIKGLLENEQSLFDSFGITPAVKK